MRQPSKPSILRNEPRPALLASAFMLAVSLLAALGWQPVISSIPVTPASGDLVLLGRGFGVQQGKSTVVVTSGDQATTLTDVVFWSDSRIVAGLPSQTGNGAAQIIRRGLLGEQASDAVPFVVQAPGLPSQPFGYQVPVQPESPWPTFRRDQRNTGRSPLPAVYTGDAPWRFDTGKGIFSTPVVDGDGVIYVGSADHNFDAIDPDGRERWRFPTGEIIDSAAALPRVGLTADEQTVLVPSGDGFLYNLRTADGSELWRFDARVSPRASYNNWFEVNVAIGYDGTLYAGNTNFNYYAINPDGSLQWTYPTGSNAWSIAGIGDDGTLYWGSNDTYVHAVRPDGQGLWTKRTLGFIAGLADNWFEKLLVTGTYITRPYPADGPASQRPAGLNVASLDYTPPTDDAGGQVSATFQLEPDASYPVDAHRPGILLLDESAMQAVSLDYHANLSATADAAGNLASVTLRIPAGTALPSALQAIVMADVYPLHSTSLVNSR